jgi:hypothetical protein
MSNRPALWKHEKSCSFWNIRINSKIHVNAAGSVVAALTSREGWPGGGAAPEAGRKWRRNPLKSLKTEPEMASRINTPEASAESITRPIRGRNLKGRLSPRSARRGSRTAQAPERDRGFAPRRTDP